MLSAYKDTFYSETLQVFRIPETSMCDQFLNYFISKNALHKSFVDYRNSCFVNPKMLKMVSREQYQNTFIKIYDNLRFGQIHTAYQHVEVLEVSNTRLGFNYFFVDKIKFVEHSTNSEFIELPRYIVNNYPDPSNDVAILISDFMEYYITEDLVYKKEKLNTILNNIESIDISYQSTLDNYYATCIILYILKTIYNYISSI